MAIVPLLLLAALAAPPPVVAGERDVAAERFAAALAALDRDHGPRAVTPLRTLRQLSDEVADRPRLISALGKLLDDPRADPEIRAMARFTLAREELARGNVQRWAGQLARLGMVDRWLVIGPFDDEGKRGHDRVEPVETALDLAARLPGKVREVGWHAVAPEAVVGGEVALGAVLRPAAEVTAYALAVVDSPREQQVRLWLGASGRTRVWVNGAVALVDGVDHPARHDQHGALVTLRAGPNQVLLKLSHTSGWMGFSLRLADARGDGVPFTARDPMALLEQLPPAPKPGPPAVPLTGLVERLQRRAGALPGGSAPARQAQAEARLDLAVALALLQTFERREAKAAAEARRAVEAAPRWIEARLLLAELEEERNRRLEPLRAARALDPREPRVQLALAELDMTADHPQAAVRRLEQVVATAPGWVEGRLALADARERAGQQAQALTERLALAERLPLTMPGLRSGALAARRLGQVKRATGLVRTALALSFDAGGVRSLLIELLLDQGDLPGVVALQREALKLDTGDAELRLALADLLAANGRLEEAELEYEVALRVCPEESEGWERRGRARLRAGRRGEALADLKRSLELRPQNPPLKELVQALEPARERYETAYLADAAALAATPMLALGGEDAVVLSDLEVVKVHPSGLASRYQQLVLRVLTQRGADAARNQVVGFTPGRQELRVERGRIHKAGGGVVEAWDESERSASEPWYRLYYDTRVRRLTFPALAPGDVLEVAWRLDDVADANLLSDYFGDLAGFDGPAPTRRKAYVLLMPAGRAIHANAPAGVTRTVRSLPDGVTEHRWEASDLPRVESEPHMPGWSESARFLHVSTYAGWDQVNAFYWDLVKDQLRPDDELRATARGLAEGALRARGLDPKLPPGGGDALDAETRRAVVAAVHAFVVTQVRYVGLEFGIHGYKPYRVDQVLARRFGDCKDKASLTHALLEAVGIESKLVLLRMRRLGRMPEQPASLAPFNHAILRIDSLDLWLDGTASYTGTREIPDEDRGATTLVVVPAGPPRFGRIPEASPADNLQRSTNQVRLELDGSARVVATSVIAGARASSYRRGYQAEADRKNGLEQSLASTFPGLAVESITLSDLARLEEPVTLGYTLRVPRFARREGGRLSFTPFGGMGGFTETWAPASTRHFDLVIGDPTESRVSYVIDLPPGQAVLELPGSIQLDGPHASLDLRYRAEGPRLLVDAYVTFKHSEVPAADYPAFRELLTRIDRALEQRVLVGPAGAAAQKAKP